MATFERFEDIECWKLARELSNRVYGTTSRRPFARDRALRDQLCRAEVSVMSNIAEGFERGTTREFARFLSIAKGSAGELRAQLYVALDQGYIEPSEFRQLSELSHNISRKAGALIQYLRTFDSHKPATPNT